MTKPIGTRPPRPTTVAPEPELKVIIDEKAETALPAVALAVGIPVPLSEPSGGSTLPEDEAEDTVVVPRVRGFGDRRPWMALGGGAGAVVAGLAIWAAGSAGVRSEPSKSGSLPPPRATPAETAATIANAPIAKTPASGATAGGWVPVPQPTLEPSSDLSPPPVASTAPSNADAPALATVAVTVRPATSPSPAPKRHPKSVIVREVPF